MEKKDFYDPYRSQRTQKRQKKEFGFEDLIEETTPTPQANHNLRELRFECLKKFFSENNRLTRMKTRIQNTDRLAMCIEQNFKKVFGIKHLLASRPSLRHKNFLSTSLLKKTLVDFNYAMRVFKNGDIIFNCSSSWGQDQLQKLLNSLAEFLELLYKNFEVDSGNPLQKEKKRFAEILFQNQMEIWRDLHCFLFDIVPFFLGLRAKHPFSKQSIIRAFFLLNRNYLQLDQVLVSPLNEEKDFQSIYYPLLYVSKNHSCYFLYVSKMLESYKHYCYLKNTHFNWVKGLTQNTFFGADPEFFEINLIQKVANYLERCFALSKGNSELANFTHSLDIIKDSFKQHFFAELLYQKDLCFKLFSMVSSMKNEQKSFLSNFFSFVTSFSMTQDENHRAKGIFFSKLEALNSSSTKKKSKGLIKSLVGLFKSKGSRTSINEDPKSTQNDTEIHQTLNLLDSISPEVPDFKKKKNCVFNLLSLYFWIIDEGQVDPKNENLLLPLVIDLFDFLHQKIGPKIFNGALTKQGQFPCPYSLPTLLNRVSSPDFLVASLVSGFKTFSFSDQLAYRLLLTRYYFDCLNNSNNESISFANKISCHAQFKRIFFVKFSEILRKPKEFTQLNSHLHLQLFIVLFESIISAVDFLESSYDFLQTCGVTDNILISLFNNLLSFVIKTKDKHYLKNGALSNMNPVQVGFDSFDKFLCKIVGRLMEGVYFMESNGVKVGLISDVEGAFENLMLENIREPSVEFISQEFIMDFYFLFSFQHRFLYMIRSLKRSPQEMGMGMPILRDIRRSHIVEDGLTLFTEMKGTAFTYTITARQNDEHFGPSDDRFRGRVRQPGIRD